MIKKFKDAKEKGAIIVFTALLLPFMMICVGLAFDLGNLYVHKTRLQNAADAAALAGARAYAASGETNSPDTVTSHPAADAEAREYVKSNAEENNLNNDVITTCRAKANNSDETRIYYRVDLEEEVPFYFLRILGTERFEKQTVKADSVAVIMAAVTYEEEKGNELFIVRHNLNIVNSIDNPDTVNKADYVGTPLARAATFNGSITYTDGSGKNPKNASGYSDYKITHSTQQGELEYFFTTKAKTEGKTLWQATHDVNGNEIEGKGNEYATRDSFADYDMSALGASTKTLLGLQDYSARNWENWDSYKSNFKTKADFGSGITSSDLSNSVAITADMANGDGNIALTIDGSVGDSDSDPIYVYFDESIYQINFNVNSSNNRPIVVCYMGTGNMHINFNNGSTFTGVIYAPNITSQEGCLINNNNNSHFVGSIIANYMYIAGGGDYTYRYLGVAGAGTTGQGSKITKLDSSTKVNLISSNDISWD